VDIIRILIAAVVVQLSLIGCSSDGPKKPEMDFYVNASDDVNDGRIVYMMARAANEKQFLDESYAEIASKAFPKTDDPELLKLQPIYPGQKSVVHITGPEKGHVAIYFMFTDPGNNWRSILELPLEDAYGIELPDRNHVFLGDAPWFFSRLGY
jgi:hypothetical protein